MMGRTARHRSRKKVSELCPYTDNDSRIVTLLKWMKFEGFQTDNLVPAIFPDSGRGLMTKRCLFPNDSIISISERFLITTQTVLSSYLGKYIRSWQPLLSPLQVLCIYLICERHRGTNSFWCAYIGSLPLTYSTPLYWTEVELDLLPNDVRDQALWQIENVRNLYEKTKLFWSFLSKNVTEFSDVFDNASFIWAWNVVNTRSVFMEQPQSEYLSAEKDHYALAPFLDLLNHTTEAKVKAGFNHRTKCYEIITLTKYAKNEQVFINYGPHDNKTLLVEYGFILPKNIHNTFRYNIDDFRHLVDRTFKITSVKKKYDLIFHQNYHKDLTCSLEGLSWTMVTCLQILIMDEERLKRWTSCLSYNYDKNYDDLNSFGRDVANHILKSSLIQLNTRLRSKDTEYCNSNVSYHVKIARVFVEQYTEILQSSLDKLNSY